MKKGRIEFENESDKFIEKEPENKNVSPEKVAEYLENATKYLQLHIFLTRELYGVKDNSDLAKDFVPRLREYLK